MMQLTSIAATLVSVVVYLLLGFWLARRTKTLGDHLPVTAGQLAKVESAGEFSAATVATTISLATVTLAFFELAPYMGPWLLWTVVTTALGLVVVRLAANRIWRRMTTYGAHRPTLHEFLGSEFGSSSVALVGAACTSLGFLGAFAVELTVGSRFLALLVPSIPPFLLVAGLATVSLAYTSAGGFRAVILTDQVQMKAIWLLLAALSLFYVIYFLNNGGVAPNLAKVPPEMLNFSWREGLGAFLVGIFIINVPTFMSDMSVWQRIAGTQQEHAVLKGLWRSVVGTMITWTLFVVIACLAPTIVTSVPEENPLFTLLRAMGGLYNGFGLLILFFVVLGLYGAMFSTASTQLVAVSHTVYLDLIRRTHRRSDDPDNRTELGEVRTSRLIIVAAAVAAMGVVALLTAAGFSIADLVFAVYGAQLGLFPPTLLALFWEREKLRRLGLWATVAIGLGFIMGWGTAGYGKYTGDANLVFLSPVASLLVSSIVLGAGVLYTRGSGSGRG